MTTTETSKNISASWRVDEIDVNATLITPAGEGPFPAVIFIAGSGPTDRDWNSPLMPGTNGSAALLATELSQRGFVTLRYDKRASGPQRVENARRLMGKISMQAHLDELRGGVDFLARRANVDAKHIFVLANSEGCIHALRYQIQTPGLPFAGLILTAPPARPVGVVARGQIAAQLKQVPDGDKWLAVYDATVDNFIHEKPIKVDEGLPEWLRNVILGMTNPVNLPFARELWVTDLADLLPKIQAPILVIIGKKDLQVDWRMDGNIIEGIAKNRSNITIVYPENANHVLKHELRDRANLTAADAATYNADDAKLDDDSLDTITSWLSNLR